MKLSNALQRIITTLKEYIDNVTPKKLSDLEIDMELGAKPIIVNISNDGEIYAADHTYEEIKANVDSGKTVLVKFKYQYFKLDSYDDTSFIFTNTSVNNRIDKMIITNDGSVTYHMSHFESLDNKIDEGSGLTPESTSQQYPSAKAVVDALSLKLSTNDSYDALGTDNKTIIGSINEVNDKTSDLKLKNIVANITGNNINGYICDISFEDLWNFHEEGRDVLFNIAGYITAKGSFDFTNTADGLVKQIRIIDVGLGVENNFVINEDNSITQTMLSYVTKSSLKQETGTAKYAPMSQKAVTDALTIKANTDYVDENFILKTAIATEEDVLKMLAEANIVTPIVDSNNNIYVSNDGKIYSL